MKLFEMEYVDKNGKLTDIDGNGTHEFKYRWVVYILLTIILPPLLIIAFICRLFKPLNR